MAPRKLTLAHLPTPIWRCDRLDELVGTRVWVKRDDMTAGAAAGNKIRKLEYLLADASERGARVVITCGGYQSNHARATAILARGLGMRSILLLRSSQTAPQPTANAFLGALCGAEIRTITPEQYEQRDALMQSVADDMNRTGEPAYVIPEGGSNGLGALGYVDAMAELRTQMDAGELGVPRRFSAVVHACGSGGTAAGVAIGIARHDVAERAVAMAVCNDSQYFRSAAERIAADACERGGYPQELGPLSVRDEWKGPGYAVASKDQMRFIIRAAQSCGLVLDPVYTGKALFGLSRMEPRPETALFIHTGGLPGLLAQTETFLASMAHDLT